MHSYQSLRQFSLVMSILFGCLVARADDPQLLQSMLEKGIGPCQTQFVVLPRPMLAGLDAQEERLTKAKELAKRLGWERFAKDSVFAPVAINIDAVKDSAGNRIAHNIHCAFVVHATLEELSDQELLESILVASDDEKEPSDEKPSDDGQGKELPPEALAENKIDAPVDGESYGQVTFPLFNRIEVSGVIHAMRVEQPRALGVAWQFDERFGGEYASQWKELTKNNLGHVVVGEGVPYTGCGGYMMVQELDDSLLLVESRMVMNEPKEWFSGSQFLRSKLPPGLQENARSFRRKLSDARKSN